VCLLSFFAIFIKFGLVLRIGDGGLSWMHSLWGVVMRNGLGRGGGFFEKIGLGLESWDRFLEPELTRKGPVDFLL
jgi:hypothetical protein